MRLLLLYTILQKYTDEEHPLSTQEIMDLLRERGVEVCRKTLYDDIATLNNHGFEVLCKKSRTNLYYVIDRNFERSEIQVLIKTISSAKFLTNKKTLVLMNKLFELLGVTESEQLKELTTISDKKDNERIYYSLDAITTAILEKKKLTFLYFDYLAKGKREYRKNKERYIVNPLGIVYANENLYLVCFHDKYEDTANYRIDRMDETRVEQVPLTHLAKFDGFDVEKYREEQFSMYSGEKEVVELVFPKELLEVAIDRFGNNIVPVATDDGEYIIRVTVQTSKTFFSWLTTFEGKVWIKSPDKVKENYKKFIENIAKKLK